MAHDTLSDFIHATAGPSSAYHLLRITFTNPHGVPATAIVLLPTTEVNSWNIFTLYNAEPISSLESKVVRYTVLSKEMAQSVEFVRDTSEEIDYLMYRTGQRIVISQDSVRGCDKFLRSIKPLYDEYAILYTADAKAKRAILIKDHFGTYADQFLRKLEEMVGSKEDWGFFWNSKAETEAVSDRGNWLLTFRAKRKHEKTDEQSAV